MSIPVRNGVKHSGFTLIELSIVLVIVGLIVGGIITGATIKRSAEVQSIITDMNKYETAARQFKEKYGYPPGDFPNATSYWGSNGNGNCANGTNITTPTALTCNGNGDGNIEGDGTGAGNNEMWEAFAAWVQLADAGYIEGQYTGTAGTACWTDVVFGVNVPATKMAGGAYTWNFFTGNTGSNGYAWAYGSKPSQQYLFVGGWMGICNQGTYNAIFTGAEAQNIDSKVDDGYPYTGKWLSVDLGPCVVANSSRTMSVYNAATTTYYSSTDVPMPFACALAKEVDW